MPRADRGGASRGEAEIEAYRALLEGSHHGVLIVQGERVAFASRSVTEITGYSRAEILGFVPGDIWARVHPDDQKIAMQRLLAGGAGDAEPPQTEFRLLRSDGSWRWIETRARRLQFRGAPATCVDLVDATERKYIELELRASDARLRLLTESRREFAMEVDADGRFVYTSPGYLEALGLPPDFMDGQLLAERMRDLLHPDDMADATQNIVLMANGGRLDEVLHRLRRSDGEWRWFETTARRIETECGVHLAILTRDVTEQLEAKREHAALVERAHQAQKLEGLALLAGGVAHDFNNVMASVRTNAELALEILPAESPVRSFVADIGQAAGRARDLTRELLAYAGQASVTVETVDLAEVATDMARLVRGTLPGGIQLSLEATPEPVFVIGDAAQLGQVVMNLLANAGDAFGDGGGTIALRTGVQRLSQSDLAGCAFSEGVGPGEFAFLSVVDTGCGIAPEHLTRVFDPFFTTKRSGRGLGLSGVFGTVRGHQGTLRFTSHPGVGTRFEIFLPCAASAAEAPAPAKPREPGPVIGGVILVVDDQPGVRQAAALLLRSRGYRTAEAGGGREAIEIARREPDALGAVLLDVTMPDLGGNRVFAELRRLRSDLPIVFMSGQSEKDILALTRDRDRVAAIAKPFSGDEVMAALRQAGTVLSS